MRDHQRLYAANFLNLKMKFGRSKLLSHNAAEWLHKTE